MIRSPKQIRNQRTGFTLVELLVAMTIFAILATLTISAWRGTDADRVSNAAAVFKNALEGAKSRAIKSGESRGLRLNLDPNDNTIVTSVVYVDGGRFESGKLYLEYDNRVAGDDGYQPSRAGKWRASSTDTALWSNFSSRGLIGPGTLIEIPSGSGNWLRLTSDNEPIGGRTWWILDGSIAGLADTAGSPPGYARVGYTLGTKSSSEGEDGGSPIKSTFGLPTANATEVDYRMQLMPALLAGGEPISLPLNTCIDLVGSKIPLSWLPNSSISKTAYGPTTGFMDILFTPRGTVARPLTTEGTLHFRVASTVDLVIGRPATMPPRDSSSRAKPVVITDPQRGAKLVSIVTQTGSLVNADVSGEGNTSGDFNNEVADLNAMMLTGTSNPFYYAIYGKESQ
ncbi:pilus assembly FimT family protein [Planctomicrobium sp. SH661]|uniref:pilus assembly FimT family protein n=1 Tax=Planctomicrobium sp. SH661 TaxID=3448124 RepID=UPI003F5B0FFB